jgi:hypothetical protein
MRCVILQPSYLPWRGYFHLIERADVFVFYDDVQFDKHGWRNRNRIKTANGPTWLTIPVAKKGNVTEGLAINEVVISDERRWPAKHLATIRQAYARAPYLAEYDGLLDEFFTDVPRSLADFTIETTVRLARELGLERTFVRSSELGVTGDQTERLVRIVQHLGATEYLSGPSAKDYLDERQFSDAGIALEYMAYDYAEYPQLHPPFEPQVSVLDLLVMAGQDAPAHIWGTRG